ncbi:MAG: hypothetical protein DRP54_08535 [Spirochaetes bacterium]|nr:MAG: hypothetical protein DRP54_08535 [Spirochaetota bacterium]
MKFSEAVYEIVKRIPKGRVSTYSEVAKAIGKPKAFRAVGQVLKRNKNPDVPCHRVVMSSGCLGGFKGRKSSREKEILLKGEGISIRDGRVDLKKYGFRFSKNKKIKEINSRRL